MATARMASLASKSLVCLVLSAQVTAPEAVEAVDVDHPEPHPAVGVELVDGLLDIAALRAAQHLRGVGDVAGQPERRRAAAVGASRTPAVRIARTRLSKRAMRMIVNVVRWQPETPGTGEESWQTVRRWR